MPETLKNIKNIKYTLNGKFSFEADNKEYEIDKEDVLEITYALFDWAGLDYKLLDEISEKVEG